MQTKSGQFRSKILLSKLIGLVVVMCASLAVTLTGQTLTVLESSLSRSRDVFTFRTWQDERLVFLYAQPLYRWKFFSEMQLQDAYDTILARGDYKRLAPSAARVTIKSDAVFYVIADEDGNLQKGPRLTATDVVSTFESLANPMSISNRYSRLFNRYKVKMNVENDSQIVTTCNSPSFDFHRALCFPVAPRTVLSGKPIPEVISSGSALEKFQRRPIGSGQFAFNRESSKSIELKRTVPKAAGFREVVIQEINPIDLENYLKLGVTVSRYICVPHLPPGLHQRLNNQQYANPYFLNLPSITGILLNCANKTLSDSLVRQALSTFTDRDNLVMKILNDGRVTNGPMPPNYSFGCPDCEVPNQEFDPERGNRFLRSAQFEQKNTFWTDKAGQPLTVTVIYPLGTPGNWMEEVCEALVSRWSELGVKAEKQALNYQDYLSRIKKGDYEAAIYEITYREYYPELDIHFCSSKLGGSENYSRFADRNVDALWQEWIDASSAALTTIYKNLHTRIGTQVPMIFLWSPEYWSVYSANIGLDRLSQYPDNIMGKVYEWEALDEEE